MDNYPVGAAGDPRAPYNEIPPREVDLRVTETLVKETTAFLDEGDDYKVEWWRDDEEDSSVEMCLVRCEMIVRKLRKFGRNYFAGINLYNLQQDCHAWTQESVNVEEL